MLTILAKYITADMQCGCPVPRTKDCIQALMRIRKIGGSPSGSWVPQTFSSIFPRAEFLTQGKQQNF